MGIRSVSTAASLMRLTPPPMLPLALGLKASKPKPLVHLLPVYAVILHHNNIHSFIYSLSLPPPTFSVRLSLY